MRKEKVIKRHDKLEGFYQFYGFLNSVKKEGVKLAIINEYIDEIKSVIDAYGKYFVYVIYRRNDSKYLQGKYEREKEFINGELKNIKGYLAAFLVDYELFKFQSYEGNEPQREIDKVIKGFLKATNESLDKIRSKSSYGWGDED